MVDWVGGKVVGEGQFLNGGIGDIFGNVSNVQFKSNGTGFGWTRDATNDGALFVYNCSAPGQGSNTYTSVNNMGGNITGTTNASGQITISHTLGDAVGRFSGSRGTSDYDVIFVSSTANSATFLINSGGSALASTAINAGEIYWRFER